MTTSDHRHLSPATTMSEIPSSKAATRASMHALLLACDSFPVPLTHQQTFPGPSLPLMTITSPLFGSFFMATKIPSDSASATTFTDFHGHWMRKQGVELEDEDTHDNKDEVPDGVLPTMHKHVEEHPMRSDKDCGQAENIKGASDKTGRECRAWDFLQKWRLHAGWHILHTLPLFADFETIQETPSKMKPPVIPCRTAPASLFSRMP
ncbi:hypothetical protein JHK82_043474 [Glycine max]|nr:hypothetical protein JHK82_043474 [Glycine max]